MFTGIIENTGIVKEVQNNGTNKTFWVASALTDELKERCRRFNGRVDGHIVQGHVDATAACTAVIKKDGSWEYSFTFPEKFSALVIEKGSITLNGISLTLFNVGINSFSVAVIPYTYEHTNIKGLKEGDGVNVEFDMLGKYVQRMLQQKAVI